MLRLAVLAWILFSGRFVVAAAPPEQAIRTVLDEQVRAWNRGDVKSFASSYAAHCTLVGSTISDTTREQVVEHYRKKYPSPGAMGKLTFSALAIHLIDGQVATATGRWHLDRDGASGGPVGGVFSLVLELVDGAWQVKLDHTS